PDQRAADNTPRQLRQLADPELVARIRALNLRPVALLFSLARGLKPLLERVDPRVLADGVPFGRVVAHAGLREGVSGTGKELPAEGAAPLERGWARVNRRTHRDPNLSRRLSLRRVRRRSSAASRNPSAAGRPRESPAAPGRLRPNPLAARGGPCRRGS